MDSTLQREILTVEQAAEVLQSSRHMVYRLISSGDLKAARVGGKYWRITRARLLELCGGHYSERRGTRKGGGH